LIHIPHDVKGGSGYPKSVRLAPSAPVRLSWNNQSPLQSTGIPISRART
jgi:hypothetical protein